MIYDTHLSGYEIPVTTEVVDDMSALEILVACLKPKWVGYSIPEDEDTYNEQSLILQRRCLLGIPPLVLRGILSVGKSRLLPSMSEWLLFLPVLKQGSFIFPPPMPDNALHARVPMVVYTGSAPMVDAFSEPATVSTTEHTSTAGVRVVSSEVKALDVFIRAHKAERIADEVHSYAEISTVETELHLCGAIVAKSEPTAARIDRSHLQIESDRGIKLDDMSSIMIVHHNKGFQICSWMVALETLIIHLAV
ncbi:hypothetical protein Nepgr_021787 [Nepenthes gracilis]|uniref:Uncharacterized protein n=1 Tax=Nepenthes gracilis TaxID=150966 RepID=A0AAD3SZN1_NEPGR|nr:hypothetical protein Nepgr_021787 [Nepenthes gracilis]